MIYSLSLNPKRSTGIVFCDFKRVDWYDVNKAGLLSVLHISRCFEGILNVWNTESSSICWLRDSYTFGYSTDAIQHVPVH